MTDSNVLEPGSISALRAVPSEGGGDVEMTLCRTFRNGPEGRIGSAINWVRRSGVALVPTPGSRQYREDNVANWARPAAGSSAR